VDDALAVGLLEGLRDLLGDLEGLADGNRALREALLEVLALDELEREEGLPARLLEPVDGGDRRVVEGGEEVGLAAEAREALRIGIEIDLTDPESLVDRDIDDPVDRAEELLEGDTGLPPPPRP